ncbi:MAG TPA: adaptor protein MecA [Pseudogracilibacillus sp.]|nr:adaptor protein MecA [Pseudogracilibacillus sp.]
MEIERINENTVKFYITYVDIENRGFEKEEIWYNRERSEQLFWQMMDEVNFKEDFSVEGPLWIQVQAMDKGLEIVVTKAKVSKDGEHFEFPKEGKSNLEMSISNKLENFIENEIIKDDVIEKSTLNELDYVWGVFEFDDIEDMIDLSHALENVKEDNILTKLYGYENKYYLYIEMNDQDIEYQDDLLSQISEYSEDSDITTHLLEEYGTVIFEDKVFTQIRSYFDIK